MKKRWLVISFVLVAMALLVMLHPTLFEDFSGTYTSGSGPFQVTVSVVHNDCTFYYTDQNQKRYIKGHFIENTDGTYTLQCGPNNRSVIPDQTIVYSNKQFAMTIEGMIYQFRKTSNTPTWFADRQHYN